MDYELLNRFLLEIFHKSNLGDQLPSQGIFVAILSPSPPTKQVTVLLRQSCYSRRVQYFVGSSKSSWDLKRVGASRALAIYIIPDMSQAQTLRQEEDSTLLSAISVQNYLWSKQPPQPAWSSEQRYRQRGSSFGFNTAVAYAEASNSSDRAPLTIVKLTSTARCRQVLHSAGVDVILCIQVVRCLRITMRPK